MDGNYKSIYPEKKKKWPNEEQQKRAEAFEKGFKGSELEKKEDSESSLKNLWRKIFKKEQK
jgi:hypothetical protein